MTISTEKKVWTDEEFMELSKDGHCYELVNGELVNMGNSGMEQLAHFWGGFWQSMFGNTNWERFVILVQRLP